ncbi:MAG: holin [Agathobacter sp.]|nr:holin [Agathobacter sp.]
MNERWWKAAGIRALKTFFQSFVATIGSSLVIEEVNWKLVLSAAALAAILSLATSLAGLPELEVEEK